MTMDELKDYPSDMLTCQQVSKVLSFDAQAIRLQARERPELLGFPVVVCGKSVRIPRKPFLKFVEGE